MYGDRQDELLFYRRNYYCICYINIFNSTIMKVSENTSISMPMKNMLAIIAGVAMGVFAYTEVTSRLTSLETSRELFQADLLKKSEQLPTDQEQYMLIEDLYKTTEKLEITQEQNMILTKRKKR